MLEKRLVPVNYLFALYSHKMDLTYKHIVRTKSTPNARLAFGETEEPICHEENSPNIWTYVKQCCTIGYLAQVVKTKYPLAKNYICR